MTRHKGFKALVRARMHRTGETYTAARTAFLEDGRIDVARAGREQRRIIARMFDGDRLRAIPAKRKRRAAVLLEVLTRFAPGRTYPESEVSGLLAAVHDDFAYLRRELVSFGYLQRSSGHYWVCPVPPDRTDREQHELPEWESIWLPGFVAGATPRVQVA